MEANQLRVRRVIRLDSRCRVIYRGLFSGSFLGRGTLVFHNMFISFGYRLRKSLTNQSQLVLLLHLGRARCSLV